MCCAPAPETGQQRRVVDRLGVDRRQETTQVERVEEPHAVEHHGRPFGGAATDVGHRHEVGRCRGRRRYGDRPQDIGLQHGRHGLDQGRVHHVGIPRDRDRVSLPGDGFHSQGVQQDRCGRQEDLDRVGRKLGVLAGPLRVSEGVRLNARRAGWRTRDCERPEAVGDPGLSPGDGSVRRDANLGEGNRFETGAVSHDARQGCHGAPPATGFPFRTRVLLLRPGHHDDLGPHLDISQIGARQEAVQGAGHVEAGAFAADVVTGRQQGGTECDLHARTLREPCEGVGEGHPLHLEPGRGGQERARFGFDPGPAPQQRDLPRILGGKAEREQGGEQNQGSGGSRTGDPGHRRRDLFG